jgi:ribose transport system substrate-binding protein
MVNRIYRLFVIIIIVTSVIGLVSINSAGKIKGEIAFIPPAMESPFYAACIVGAKPAAEKLGYKLLVLSPEKPDDYAGQVKIVEDMVQKKVQGLAICAHDDKAIVSAILKANAAKIPVVIFNSLTDLPGGVVYAYSGYDQASGAARIAVWVNKVKNGKANVAILQGLPGFHATERTRGFVDKAKEFAGIKIIGMQPADWAREKGMNVAQNMLQANPNIDVFYGENDESALGAAQACKQLGKNNILTVGIDGNPNAMDAINKGELSATLYVNPVGIGAKAIQLLDDAINGKPAPANNKVAVDTIVVDKSMVSKYLTK